MLYSPFTNNCTDAFVLHVYSIPVDITVYLYNNNKSFISDNSPYGYKKKYI